MNDPIEIAQTHSNPFRAAGVSNPDRALAKARVGAEIVSVLDARRLSVREAGEISGAGHADIARIRNADLAKFTLDRLVGILHKLAPEIEVRLTFHRAPDEMHAAE